MNITLKAGDTYALEAAAGYVNVVDHGAVGNGIANDAPAFQAAGALAGLTGRTVWVPPGTYRIASEVALYATSPSDVAFSIAGHRGASRIVCDAPGANILYFGNWLSVDIRDLTFAGVAGRLFDAYAVLGFGSCSGIHIRDCVFKGTAASGPGVINNYGGDLVMTDVQFAGATGAEAVVRSRAWRRCDLLRVTFNDIGKLDGSTAVSKVGTNTNQLIPPAWVRADDVALAIAGFSQSAFRMRSCWLDENAARGIQVLPTTNRLYAVEIDDCQVSTGVTQTGGAASIEISNATHVHIKNTYVSELNGPGAFQRDALRLANVKRTHLEGFRCPTEDLNANRITTDADCPGLVLSGMAQGVDYRTLSPNNATAVTTNP